MRRIVLLALLFCLTLPSLAQENSQTPYEIALQYIAEAEASGATELDLSGLGLTELPPEIGNLIHLAELDLSNNQLTSLPPEIGRLNKLCWLFLENNQLQYLPAELYQIEGLRGIGHGNLYDCITYGIFLGGNPLIFPPAEIIPIESPVTLNYLKNEAWWHLQRLIVGGASSLGLVAAVVLGIRWRQRGKEKKKNALG
jgi:Leucine-rich repeat (LRR) protein